MLAKIRSFVGAALLAGLAVSCASDEETAAYRGAPVCRYTVPEAMQTYARTVARSSRTEEEAGPLAPGAYRLDWAAARISIDSSLYSADVPIEMAYAYGRYRPGAADSAAIAPVYAAMVTVRNPASGGSSCYLRFYVPDDDHLAAHGPSDYANLLNSNRKTGYSGLSIYATLGGEAVAVGRYEEGLLDAYAFLYEEGRTFEANFERMRELLEGLQLVRVRRIPAQSRASDPPKGDGTGKTDGNYIWDNGGIETVVIIGKRPPKPEPDPEPEERFELPIPSEDGNWPGGSGKNDGGGGGGTSSSSSSDGNSDDSEKEYEWNIEIKYEDEQVGELLDSLGMDCMGKTLIRSLDGVTILTGQDGNYYDYANNTIHLQNHDKYGYRDYVLLEELIHCYQRENRPNNGAPVPKLNDEIEAKVGWLLYLDRNGRSLTPQQAVAQLGFGYLNVYTLAYYTGGFGVFANRSDNTMLYDDLYMDARDALTVKYQGYYFSEKRDDWEMVNLINLLKDC